ncbi:family 20 glycosylhydrolase [Neotabrizicola shimadae]|uniref:beta-N-acetylhexosaminidase n=1 Tax=Neotabrizicola shimadae TaxID=2807096 RepID=A0A8G1EEV5_9RHOB|nr:family 20 glycosylhydrolase [Neotabrizicola shimadae]
MSFDAAIEGRTIRCRIGTDRALKAPVFCYSLMAANRPMSGGVLVRSVAGYSEVALPDLSAGALHEVVLEHVDPEYRPRNRAWLPLGPYLRHAGGVDPLPPLPSGVISGEAPEPPPCPGLRLVPPPQSWAAATGVADARGGFSTRSHLLDGVEALAGRLNLGPFLRGSLALRLHHDPTLVAEGYRLEIGAAGVDLTHGDATGAFYGGVTLLQLKATHEGMIPCGAIEDAPRFGWRGQHLDCARHFYRPETILRLMDLMALFKLNRLHWHFADDEAFRLEVDCLPDLWRKTAYRGEGELVPGVFGGGIRSGGSYSKGDVATVLERSAALHIGVLPEIEVPAHAFAFNQAVPGLRDPGDNGAEISIQGYAQNVLNPALEATWDTLIPLAEEVAGLFPMRMLHLGCDELPPGAWEGSPLVTALKAREGLAGRDEVQGWMMERLAGHLAARGIRPAAWEEAAKGAQGGIGHEALMFSWTGQGPGIAAARMGHDVVMCPAQKVYFDMAHTGDADDWGAAWAAFVNLEETVNWSPVPKGAEDVAHRIVGVQGCFWSEFTTADAEIEPMIAPRILGLACKAWEPDGLTSGPRLRELAGALGPVFDTAGWTRHRTP